VTGDQRSAQKIDAALEAREMPLARGAAKAA